MQVKSKTRSFRVYPFENKDKRSDKTCWYTVTVFDALKDMQKASMDKCPVCKHSMGGSKKCLGVTHRHGHQTKIDIFGNILKTNIKGELGKIFFASAHADSRIVAHEMAHAMLYIIRSNTCVINFEHGLWHEMDEYMAQILGNLVHSYNSNVAAQ